LIEIKATKEIGVSDLFHDKRAIVKSTYSYHKDEEVYGQGTAATYIYQVINGAIRISSKLTNGRRQIGAFYFSGDIFGLESGIRHRWSAEAIAQATTVRRVKRKALLRKARSNLSLARSVGSITERDLLHAEDHRILLGQLTATERIAAFLLQINDRIGVNGEIELPMSRGDVGDYLGLTLETVSREVSKLSGMGILRRIDGHSRWTRGLSLRRPERLRAMLPPFSALALSPVSERVVQTIF
jgi:CRP/FNR family nitrogen fixation transcriptional regulator